MVTKEYNLPYRVVHIYHDGRITVESFHRTVKAAQAAVNKYRSQTRRKNYYEIQKREIITARAHSIENWSTIA